MAGAAGGRPVSARRVPVAATIAEARPLSRIAETYGSLMREGGVA